jgi:NTE family protein
MKKAYFPLLLFVVIILLTGCFCPHKFIPKSDPKPPVPFSVPDNIRVALVLGSGGVRGMAHVGALEVLVEAGIPIDLIVGCSAGSLVGALYADNPCIEDLKEAVSRLKANNLLDIDVFNCRYGLCQGRSMRSILNEYLNADTFQDLKIPLIVVATDLHSGELVPIVSGDVVKAVEASCAIPFVFVPVEIDGRILVDGGTINPVPVLIARDLKPDIIIAIDLCELLPSTFPTTLFGVFWRSAEIIFMWQNEVCTRHADVVIRPKMCEVGTFNDKARYSLYCAGREAAQKALPLIYEALANLQDSNCSQSKREVTLNCYKSDNWSSHHGGNIAEDTKENTDENTEEYKNY